MPEYPVWKAQQEPQAPSSEGTLRISVVSSVGMIPIQHATVTISYTGDPQTPLMTLSTDESGQTPPVSLPAPNLEYSLEPEQLVQPYSEYNIEVTAEGYEPVLVSGTEVLPDVTAIQPISMIPLESNAPEEDIFIPEHTLFGEYPPKIPEDEIKPMDESGEIVLSRVVIPEYVIVHDGVPSDPTAQNYYVRYKDYIKNVASCEIYATWPESAIYANILVIMSFTLNRVYTEWYRNQGYDFTITSSTAYDQKWIHGRNIFDNIDVLVDNIFANFLSRPGVRQPIFTSYCDGKRVTCSGLKQWGSKYLADEGYAPIEIIRYYYGNDMYINTADVISGIPASCEVLLLTQQLKLPVYLHRIFFSTTVPAAYFNMIDKFIHNIIAQLAYISIFFYDFFFGQSFLCLTFQFLNHFLPFCNQSIITSDIFVKPFGKCPVFFYCNFSVYFIQVQFLQSIFTLFFFLAILTDFFFCSVLPLSPLIWK